jgi:hypothetical protein
MNPRDELLRQLARTYKPGRKQQPTIHDEYPLLGEEHVLGDDYTPDPDPDQPYIKENHVYGYSKPYGYPPSTQRQEPDTEVAPGLMIFVLGLIWGFGIGILAAGILR